MYTVRLNHNTIKIAIAQERLDSMFGIFYDYSPNVHIITTNKTTKKRKKTLQMLVVKFFRRFLFLLFVLLM